MERRRFLATTALLGASALAGCAANGSGTPPSPPDAPAGVADWSFTAPVEDGGVGRDQQPRVTCNSDAERVRIVGTCPVGNNCSALYPADVTHVAGELSLTVSGWEPARDCGEALRVASYEAEFAMVEGLPETVRATEPADANGDETRTTTVDC